MTNVIIERDFDMNESEEDKSLFALKTKISVPADFS